MKLMRYTIVCLLSLLLVSAAACGAQNTTPSAPPAISTASQPPATPPAEGEGQVFTGTVDEVKDFMITATDEAGDAYVFGTDGLEAGALDGIKVGDQVNITYTGDLTDMDSTLSITAIQKVV